MSIGLLVFTLFHVGVSLIGIGSGFVVIYGLLTVRRFDGWTVVFLATTVLTSVTGFLFPATHFTPGHAVGILSLMILGPALWARYRERMSGRWRSAYVVCGIAAQYFNFVVLIIQLFAKVPPLHELAPTQSELPFVGTQLVVLAAFIGVAIASVIRFRDPSANESQPPTDFGAVPQLTTHS
jgi:hypothetical protein